jgi:meso-butanediol dehydrogenase/(S,S)-butanediol dehydrogenase/diacetyl reductase
VGQFYYGANNVASLFSTAINRFGSVDASFHVAGANKHAYIARMEEADWDFTINLCLKGVMFAMKHAAQAMLKQGHGAMVNIASLNAHVPMHAGAAYLTCPPEMFPNFGRVCFSRGRTNETQ